MAKKAAHTTNNLSAAVRAKTGKGASRLARREGRVPVVLYGHGTDPQHLEISAREFAAVLRNSGTNAILTLDIAGKEQLALTKSVVVHPIKRNIEHADLVVVTRGEKVTVDVTVVVEGDAASGTLIAQDANTIQIEAEAMSIPEQLVLSVEGIEAGTQILASQIELPAGVSLVTDPETLVVNVVAAPTAEQLDSEGAGETEGQAADGGEAAAEAAAESE